LENYLVNISLNYLENFLIHFICIHVLVKMDPRQQTEAEDGQLLMNMIAKVGGAQGDAPEHADDGSNTDIYLNMSGDGLKAPSIHDDAAAEQDDATGEQNGNVHITTIHDLY
jgi:hypothetical protein